MKLFGLDEPKIELKSKIGSDWFSTDLNPTIFKKCCGLVQKQISEGLGLK